MSTRSRLASLFLFGGIGCVFAVAWLLIYHQADLWVRQETYWRHQEPNFVEGLLFTLAVTIAGTLVAVVSHACSLALVSKLKLTQDRGRPGWRSKLGRVLMLWSYFVYLAFVGLLLTALVSLWGEGYRPEDSDKVASYARIGLGGLALFIILLIPRILFVRVAARLLFAIEAKRAISNLIAGAGSYLLAVAIFFGIAYGWEALTELWSAGSFLAKLIAIDILGVAAVLWLWISFPAAFLKGFAADGRVGGVVGAI